MEIQDYLEQIKAIQNQLLLFLDDNDDNQSDIHYQELICIFQNFQVDESSHKLKLILNLILAIAKNHHRNQHFFPKIEKIILFLKNSIKQTYSNFELYKICKFNKRILLIFIENKMLIIDETIANDILNNGSRNTINYFYPEIKPFLKDNKIKIKILDDIEEKRKLGENEQHICQLIQNDSVDEFISYVTKNSTSLTTIIEQSIFETNSFLQKRLEYELIEYATFYGSIQIFRYLYQNGVKLKPSLWFYAIHSNKPEIIHFLEDNHIELSTKIYDSNEDVYKKLFKESIKCHHNDIANYYLTNFLTDEQINDENNSLVSSKSIRYYNFEFLKSDIKSFDFVKFCQFDYYDIVKMLLNDENIDINYKIVSFNLFLYCFKFVFLIKFENQVFQSNFNYFLNSI